MKEKKRENVRICYSDAVSLVKGTLPFAENAKVCLFKSDKHGAIEIVKNMYVKLFIFKFDFDLRLVIS